MYEIFCFLILEIRTLVWPGMISQTQETSGLWLGVLFFFFSLGGCWVLGTCVLSSSKRSARSGSFDVHNGGLGSRGT